MVWKDHSVAALASGGVAGAGREAAANGVVC